MRVEIKTSFKNDKMNLPAYAHPGDAGFDLQANLEAPLDLWPHQIEMIGTGVSLGLSSGWEVQVRSRSGLAMRHGVSVLNAPGTVDSTYQLEVGVILMNMGTEPVTIYPGDRIAQGVLKPVYMVDGWVEVEEFSEETDRVGGFGSTGR